MKSNETELMKRKYSYFYIFNMRVVLSVFVLAIVILGSSDHHHVDADGERELYIVYMGELKHSQTRSQAIEVHQTMISEVIQEDVPQQYLVHSFGRSFDGFIAYLLPEEIPKLKEKEGVVSVFPNMMYELHTTKSWDYLGLNESSKRGTAYKESDLIVGVLDTGIYIQGPSFNDTGYGPPPVKWKGKCDTGRDFPGCNKKVIGARTYDHVNLPSTESTPADNVGHGSHTSSTVAGSLVEGASLYGLGKGTAKGGVPSARIAMYQVCNFLRCFSAALLAAFDDAIADGVDIISLSVGGVSMRFFNDAIAIGSFHAMKKGVLTSCSAGNEGALASVSNGAPWILTVAASFGNRVFKTPVRLGDDTKIWGDALNTFDMPEFYPLIDIGTWKSLLGLNVTGQIVFCADGGPRYEPLPKIDGAVGLIMGCDPALQNEGFLNPDLPTACITDEQDLKTIQSYIKSNRECAEAVIQRTESVMVDAPSTLASFSSRGPDINAIPILKPDIAAPGVNILAGYSKLSNENTLEDKPTVFNMLSGTSMACPHASATAAYVKTFHPDWSPAAIKSAIMTTAKEFKAGVDYPELGYGSGQIDPVRAVEPGLIYNLTETDYLGYLCQQGYNSSVLSLISGEKIDCSNISNFGGQDHINYPSMALIQTKNMTSISADFHRTVTNVGEATATYTATVKAPAGVNITVKPDKLVFKELNEEISFTVHLQAPLLKDSKSFISASLLWTHDEEHRVRSPIFVYSEDVIPKNKNLTNIEF